VRSQLKPYISDNPGRFAAAGEPIALPVDLATPFGLVLHELATNATKHGALSREGGKIDVSWTLDTRNNQRLLKVDWKESGGPPVKEPEATGFGSSLIEKGIPNAAVSREFHPGGLVCKIELPLLDGEKARPPEKGRAAEQPR
jgi:two-component system CheB/CheR fusion protein